MFLIFCYNCSSATSTATSLSSATHYGKNHDSEKLATTTNDSPVICRNISSHALQNGYTGNGSSGRSKDGGRPDLLAMTPSRNDSTNSISGSPTTHSKSRNRCYESRLKEHINQLKAERASLQQQFDIQHLSDVLSSFDLKEDDLSETKKLQTDCEDSTKINLLNQGKISGKVESQMKSNITKSDSAIKIQAKEREADLEAKLYLINQEKRSLEMKLDDRHSLESMLRAHIEHLREENDRLSRGEGRLSSLSREDKLGKRVDGLLQTLDRVTRNSEQRQIHSDELMGDLKRANRYAFIVIITL